MSVDKTEFFKSLIGEVVSFSIPLFKVTGENSREGKVTGADCRFVYIDEEPFPVESVEIE